MRTDLALEIHNRIHGDKEIGGIRVESYEREGKIAVTNIGIETENAAKEMERPRGKYVTIDFSKSVIQGEDYQMYVTNALVEVIGEWVFHMKQKDGFTVGKQGDTKLSVLVAGLGNKEEIIDALGPKVVEQIPKSRHIMKEFGKYGYGSEEVSCISGIAPGVSDTTGMEAQEVLKGIVGEIEPDVLITIDALVGRDAKRIGKTIQLTSAGIVPGSGVGVHRRAISKETMGIPVIAIGVPLVLDVSYGYFLVPKDVTSMVNNISHMIAGAIKTVFYE
jgi:spore protease